jgi:hypothetical protein
MYVGNTPQMAQYNKRAQFWLLEPENGVVRKISLNLLENKRKHNQALEAMSRLSGNKPKARYRGLA